MLTLYKKNKNFILISVKNCKQMYKIKEKITSTCYPFYTLMASTLCNELEIRSTDMSLLTKYTMYKNLIKNITVCTVSLMYLRLKIVQWSVWLRHSKSSHSPADGLCNSCNSCSASSLRWRLLSLLHGSGHGVIFSSISGYAQPHKK